MRIASCVLCESAVKLPGICHLVDLPNTSHFCPNPIQAGHHSASGAWHKEATMTRRILIALETLKTEERIPQKLSLSSSVRFSFCSGILRAASVDLPVPDWLFQRFCADKMNFLRLCLIYYLKHVAVSHWLFSGILCSLKFGCMRLVAMSADAHAYQTSVSDLPLSNWLSKNSFPLVVSGIL